MKHVAEALLPTRFGKFIVHAFVDDKGKEHLALARCAHPKHKAVPVRIHSRCLTGDTLTSVRCDCRDQLKAAMKYLEKKECGILIYLDQEGRGIGLANKIRAYALQDAGMDTVEANRKLGFRDDMRDFSAAADILKYFEISNISLLTNNPDKIAALEENGITVVERIPLITKTNRYNEKYIRTKKEKMGHQF
ncbi:GTP cyclohydrolase II [Candidatus Micrarchaeota archaeon]|nr:GTP cyclohydrolase II [Candidatus Micrarchaeota archaeon]